MATNYNISIRVKAYNKQFKNKEAIIFLKKGSTDPNEATNYTSLLYERYLKEGTMLEIDNGMYRFHKRLGGIGGLNLRALNFLQVLAYLEYFEDWRKKRNDDIRALFEKINEEERAKKLALKKEKTISNGFELVEEDGVTKIKGTNFVISKFM